MTLTEGEFLFHGCLIDLKEASHSTQSGNEAPLGATAVAGLFEAGEKTCRRRN